MSDIEWPTAKYRLNQPAHIGMFPGDEHRVLDAGVEILYDGKPGPHMDPVDEAAHAAKARVGKQVLDFTQVEPLTHGDEQDLLAERTAVAVVKALAAAGVLPTARVAAAPQVAAAAAPMVAVPGLTIETAPPVAAAPPPPPPPPPIPAKASKAA